MALKDLVAYAALRCANMPNRCNLYEMAAKYGWDEADMLAFLRCEKAPSNKMLCDMAKELDDSVSNFEHVLNR